MCKHPRLGSASAGRILTRDVIKYICFKLLEEECLYLFCGLESGPGPKIDDSGDEDDDQELHEDHETLRFRRENKI